MEFISFFFHIQSGAEFKVRPVLGEVGDEHTSGWSFSR